MEFMGRSYLYILDGKTPVPEPDPIKWSQWFEKADRQVGLTYLDTNEVISTVFLGTDYCFSGDGEPVLFETLVIGGSFDGNMVRTKTWEQAELCHRAMVEAVMTWS